MSQKTAFFIVTAVKTSNLTRRTLCYPYGAAAEESGVIEVAPAKQDKRTRDREPGPGESESDGRTDGEFVLSNAGC
jgi:hypothetical protein